MEKKKFLVPKDMTMANFMFIIRQKMKLKQEKSKIPPKVQLSLLSPYTRHAILIRKKRRRKVTLFDDHSVEGVN